MTKAFKVLIAALFVLVPGVARAQTSSTSSNEFFPELDFYTRLDSNIRLVFQAKGTREGGDPTQQEVGPSIEFYLKPLLRLRKATAFDSDEAKSRLLVLAIGYRWVPSATKPTTQRMEPVVTGHYPLKGEILLTDRNRFDLDWSNGKYTWRYRNRFTVERRLTIHSYHPAPYASAEFFYESQYSKWSTTTIYAGCQLPLTRHFQLDPYYQHENNTGKAPNQQVNAFGLILNVYFPANKN